MSTRPPRLRLALAAALVSLAASEAASAAVYRSPATGAHEVRGSIEVTYLATGGPGGPLGHPLTSELPTPDGLGRFTHFERGSIYWSPTTGAHMVRGAIRDRWAALGWERGPLGYPVRGEYDVDGGWAVDFQGGFLRQDAATGAVREALGQVLAAGVTHRRIDDPAGPFSSRVLTLDPSGPATLDVGLAQGRLAGFETTSSLSRRHRAIAAVNGDFGLPSGRPVHLYAEDGRLLQAPALVENALATTGQGIGVVFGRPAPVMTVSDSAGRSAPLARVNSGTPAASELSLVTAAGAGLEEPPPDACSARLGSAGAPRLDGSGATTTTYRVREVRCGRARMPVRRDAVLSAPLGGQHERFARGLRRGSRVTVAWSLGWPGSSDANGGNAVLVEGGRLTPQVHGSDPFFGRHPRTGIGVTSSGQVLLVTVDGRQPRHSVGMTLVEFGELFRSLGAERALLLDGGGSTTMTVRGRVTNRPSDGGERPVPTALLVLDRADTVAPEPWRAGAGAATAAEVWAAQEADPASTGGWARALRRQGVPLPPELDTAVR